ncbi:hypothetical protein AA0472_2180 [Acetobacter estunensis NRIC 0472]|uniref:hypothetical protein n=1 Tax=Acetobacter estunensis TaxID=104097 RepID=UPI0018E99A1A|nr:hypothetical protein [Acetobacter estunensis]GBQ26675.1 hypothetical protein AA0472_2180 [Acetobacter estunensis NRIC 0472]
MLASFRVMAALCVALFFAPLSATARGPQPPTLPPTSETAPYVEPDEGQLLEHRHYTNRAMAE